MEPPTTPLAGPPGPQQGPPYGAPQAPGYPGMPQGSGYPGAPQGPGYPPPGYPPYNGQNELNRGTSGGTSTWAVLSFIFGLISFIPLGIIFGIVALAKIPQTRQKGKGLAIAGLVLSGLWLAGIVAAVALADPDEADRDASGQVTATQQVAPTALRVGDCVSEIKEGEFTDIKVQPCAQPNGGKVFATFEIPGSKFPGLDSVRQTAEKGCADRWTASKEQASSPSDIWYLHPTSDSWSLGDHGVACLVAPR